MKSNNNEPIEAQYKVLSTDPSRKLYKLPPKVADLPKYIQDEPWLRLPGEPKVWYERFHAWMLLGAHRTLVRATREAGQAPSSAKNWERHSIEFLWKWRADAWDNFQLESERQRREVIMHGGLALDVERVEWLRKIGQREADIVSTLQEKIANDPNANRKQLNARYQVMRSSFAETLSALAQETGGRVKRVSVSRDLVDWARQLALEKGYDVEEAARVARLVAGDAQR